MFAWSGGMPKEERKCKRKIFTMESQTILKEFLPSFPVGPKSSRNYFFILLLKGPKGNVRHSHLLLSSLPESPVTPTPTPGPIFYCHVFLCFTPSATYIKTMAKFSPVRIYLTVFLAFSVLFFFFLCSQTAGVLLHAFRLGATQLLFSSSKPFDFIPQPCNFPL